VFLFALTEGLSFFKAITATNLMIAWGIFLIIIGGYCLTKKNLLREKINSLRHSAVSLYNDNGNAVKALIIFIAFFMLARTVLAVITAPHNVDSMTYHLSRIGYWIQHQNVDYYETPELRQLFSPVFAEYINLHVFLITGGDLFANMLQNFSAYGCVFLIYGIIKRLGLSIKWALFGCVLTMSMNIFSAESMSTQVDMVSAFYLIILIYLMIEVLYQPELTIFQFILLGFISGLLYITKTNACVPAAVIIIGIALIKIFTGNFRIILLGLISLLCIGLIVSPTFYRNYNTFNGDFMAKINVGALSIGTASPKYVLVNVIKNLITIGFERNTELIRGGLKALGRFLNININAPEITLGSTGVSAPYVSPYYSLYMDLAGAHLIIPLFLMMTVISLVYLFKHRTRTEGLMFTFILQLFSILIILRSQAWASRLILPALVVVIIPIVYYFSEITKRFDKNSWKYKACYFLVLDLIFQCGICSAESLVYHTTFKLRSIGYSRYAQYWGVTQNTKFFAAYDNFSRIIDEGKYEKIGINGITNTYQYPILAKYIPEGKKIENVNLMEKEQEGKFLNPDFYPDIILVTCIKLNPEEIYTCNGNNYKCVYSMIDNENNSVAHYSVWVRENN